MFCEVSFPCESFKALAALEWSLPSVRLHVPLQMTRTGASRAALVTFEWLLHPHVNFQMTSCDAGIVACCASVWLFSRVRLLVPLQIA